MVLGRERVLRWINCSVEEMVGVCGDRRRGVRGWERKGRRASSTMRMVASRRVGRCVCLFAMQCPSHWVFRGAGGGGGELVSEGLAGLGDSGRGGALHQRRRSRVRYGRRNFGRAFSRSWRETPSVQIFFFPLFLSPFGDACVWSRGSGVFHSLPPNARSVPPKIRTSAPLEAHTSA